MSGVKAFLILATVVVVTVTVLGLLYWVVNNGPSLVVDNSP